MSLIDKNGRPIRTMIRPEPTEGWSLRESSLEGISRYDEGSRHGFIMGLVVATMVIAVVAMIYAATLI